MIINGELQTGLGGGVCQVSTTVFNAAYEAGLLDRVANEPRALHLALPDRPRRDRQLPGPRPPLPQRHRAAGCCCGRGSARRRSPSTSTARRSSAASRARRARSVVDRSAEAEARARPRRSRSARRCSRMPASRSRRTSVHRRVYDADGKLLYDTTWISYYRSEPRIVRYGTKPLPKPRRLRRTPKDEGQAGDDGAHGDRTGRDRADDDRARGRRAAAARPGRHGSGLSARAIASTSQAGTRVGRSVARRRTRACVQPSATRSPLALDRVLEAEARAADVDAARLRSGGGRRTAPARRSGRSPRSRTPRSPRARSAG